MPTREISREPLSARNPTKEKRKFKTKKKQTLMDKLMNAGSEKNPAESLTPTAGEKYSNKQSFRTKKGVDVVRLSYFYLFKKIIHFW